MIKHAFVEVGIPESSIAKLRFYDSVKYRIGRGTYSFNDIENGLLRANAKAPYHFFRQFSSTDWRKSLALEKVEKRIHFALNCGAKSCPLVKSYTVDGFEDEIRLATEAFVEDEGNVSVEGKTLSLSQIFNWYSADFGNSDELVLFLVDHARGKKREELRELKHWKVKYKKYDWTTDGAAGKYLVWKK